MSVRTVARLAPIIRHFASAGALEVAALQASPLLGIVLGGYRIERDGIVAPGVRMLGSCALTAFVFVFNDWAGYASDLRDPLRSPHVFARAGIARREVAWTAFILLASALLAFAAVGIATLALGAAIAVLGLLYSSSPLLGKGTPIASSINHLLGGTLHFLLGYTVTHALDTSGACIGLFFGLVFAAGHLNQEVRDYEGDRLNGIRTNAVAFGYRNAFVASLFTFMAAYAMLTALAASGRVPRLLLWSPVAGLVHLAWFVQALRRGPGAESALWIQRRYRWLFALIGIVMLAA
jgi:4-hydroxybenzoate polyprenyltransferase